MNDDLAIRTRGLARRFSGGLFAPSSEVLRGVDLDVPRGAVLGLVGPNGSGKSTLLRILAGVDRATAGEARVLGGAPDAPATLRATGYLPEESPFPPELPAESALGLLASLQGVPRAEVAERATRWLARVGLADARRRKLGRCSRGMLRRFGLAQAWVHEPELVLLDEPTAGLDAQGFEVLDALLVESRERGTTVVLSSHVTSDLVSYCSHVAVLLGGRIAAAGARAEVLSAPGRTVLEVDGLGAPELRALEEWLAAHGARLAASGPGGRTLLELYHDLAERSAT